LRFWDTDPKLNAAAQKALDSAQARRAFVIGGAAYMELPALPGRTENMLDGFFAATAIRIDWESTGQIWRVAGRTLQNYVTRRNRENLPRRIPADFLIGAHASVNRYRLMTMDQRLCRTAFPKLEIVSF
jgi:hypothetical protein